MEVEEREDSLEMLRVAGGRSGFEGSQLWSERVGTAGGRATYLHTVYIRRTITWNTPTLFQTAIQVDEVESEERAPMDRNFFNDEATMGMT
jgi:hypothetical protein